MKRTSLVCAFAALMLVSIAAPVFAQTHSACIAHHPKYVEDSFEVDYANGCTGHDEPELDPVSSLPGSARDFTWTFILPTGTTANPVSATGPAFWFGGTVSDPKSLFGQAFVELQFYPDSMVSLCAPTGGFAVSFSLNTYTACSPVWKVTQNGNHFSETAAFNAMLTDGTGANHPLVMHAGDVIAVHWYTTPAADGYHVTVTDVTTGGTGTIVLNSSSDGPLMPAYDTQTIGNSLQWGTVYGTPNAFVWEIGHASVYSSSAGAVCYPGQTNCPSYNGPSWGGTTPIQILNVTFADGSHPKNWAAVSDFGGIAEVLGVTAPTQCSAYGGPFCIYPWYTLNNNGSYSFGVDYATTKKDFGQAKQYPQQTLCDGPFGSNTLYCDNILH